jgi:lambda family phage tail tape measure protein
MATVKIDLSLQDQSSSIKKRTSEVQNLNKELTKSQQLATGTRTGGQAVKASLGPSMPGEGTAYGQARGSMGATGAAGRDFANQAQGLGGLVRLYATYAANVFALTAAFSALRDAMSTDIMIRGLDQLGAASGVAMGALAKNFAQASGGAISLREAMESTAKAVSSGLSSAQFMELGKVAKGASQALGVNMSDAVSRLTRGITKLEPELLDELGIFTKVGKATEDYARSVGKSVNALTDFERRQAFANAVLAEGAQKFGEIAVQTNPYDLLLASLKNTAQSILSTVNTVIAPIAKLLAENTGLITAAFALMGVKIVQQALPALLSWQKGLSAAAAVSADKLGELVNPEGFVERAQARFNVPKLEAELKQAEAVYAKTAQNFVQTDNNYKSKGSPLLKTLASGAVLEGNNYVNAVKQISKSTDDLTTAEQRHVNSLKASVAASDAVVAARKRLAAANDLVEASAIAPFTMRERAQQSAYKQAAGTRDRLEILAGVGADYDKEGFTKSIKNANEAAKQSTSLTKFGQVVTTVQAAGVAGAKSLALFGGRVLNFIPVLGTLYTAYQIFDAVLSGNAKEAKAFRDGLEQLSEIAKTNTNVFEKFGNTLSVESLNAKATAFGDLAAQIAKSTSDLQAADATAGFFDRQIDAVLSLIGKDLKSGYTKTLSVALSEGIKNIPDKGIRDELEKKLKLESGAASTSIRDLKDALDDIDPADIIKKGKALTALVDAANKPLQTSRALSQDIQTAGKATAQAELDLRNSLRKTDAVGGYFEKVVDQLNKTRKGFADTTTAAAEFQKIAAGNANINFLGADGAAQLTNIATSYTQFALNIKTTSDSLQQNKDRLAAIEKQLQSKLLYTSARNELGREADKIRGLIESQSSQLDKAKAQIVSLASQAKDIFQQAYIQAFDAAVSSANRKAQISGLEFSKGVLASSPVQTQESLKQQFEIDKQIITLKKLEITSQYDLIDALDRTTANTKILDLEKQLQGASRDSVFRKGLQDQLDTEKAKLSLIGGRISKEEFDTLRKSKDPEALAAINRNQARNLAERSARDQITMAEINYRKAAEDLGFKELTDALNAQKTSVEQQLETIKRSPEFISAMPSAQAGLLREQQDQLNQITTTLQTLPAAQTLAQTMASGAMEFQKVKALNQLGTAQTAAFGSLGLASQKLDTEADIARELDFLSTVDTYEKKSYNNQLEALQVSKDDLEYKQASLDKDLERGRVTQDEFNSRKYLLGIQQAGLERSNALLAEEQKFTLATLDIRKKIAQQGGESPETIADQKAAEAARNSGTAAIERQFDASKKLLDLNRQLGQRQLAYEDIFKNSFDNMADAILQFAQTGKISFSSLINTMIADIARFELRQQSMSIWQSLRPGIMSLIPSPGMAGIDRDISTLISSGVGLESAKGNAFDYGIQAFAKGGAFTNQIVDSPTLFKFARGTGLMGEAGPEAIMPLKRDSQGNLGVRAQGGGSNVEVVVNNFGTEKAETRETTDSRGNRKIEVTIGDMAAGEISRSGSSSQKAVGGTFGLKPQLIRR